VAIAVWTRALTEEITVRNTGCIIGKRFSDKSFSAETSSLALALSAKGKIEVRIANVIKVVQSCVTCRETLIVDAFVEFFVISASDWEVARVVFNTASAHATRTVTLVRAVCVQTIRPVVDLTSGILRSCTFVDVFTDIAIRAVSFITHTDV